MKLAAKKDYFALLFSDHGLYLAQSGRAGALRLFAKKDLPAGVIVRGEIKNPESLRAAVVELVKTAKIKNRFVVVGLPEERSFTRTFSLPPLSFQETADAVCWESEPLLPFSLKEAYLDWMILEKKAAGQRVLVVALPKKIVDGYAELLESVGLQPVAFEITSLSLARLAPRSEKAQMVLNVEPREAVLAVVGPKGGIEVSSTVSFSQPEEAFGEILSAAKSAISFYQKKAEPLPQNSISQIILTGPSLSPKLAEGLKKETGLPAGSLKNLKPELAVVTSLAGKNVASPVDEQTINLIPPRIQGIYDRESRVKEISAWAKASLLALVIILAGFAGVWAKMIFETRQIDQKTLALRAVESDEYQEVENQVLFLNNRAQKVISLKESFSPKLALLELLLRQGSPEIRLRQIIFDGENGAFLVSGLAANRNHLIEFKKRLEKDELIKQVQLPLSSLEKEENADFTVSVIGY